MDRDLVIDAINSWAQNLKLNIDSAAQSLRKDVNEIVRSGGSIESISAPEFKASLTLKGKEVTIEGWSESPAIVYERGDPGGS